MAQISNNYKLLIFQSGRFHDVAQVYDENHEMIFQTREKFKEGINTYDILVNKVNKRLKTNFKTSSEL